MLATTRTLVRRAMATATATIPVSTSTAAAASTCCRAVGAQSAVSASASANANAFRCSTPVLAITSTRGFSTLPTDEGDDEGGDGDSEAKKEEETPSSTTTETDDATVDATTAAPENNGNINELNKNLKPSEIVEALDRHIVGQADAKKSVAIAMRNRWRRRQLPEDLRKEVTPRNVLLVGPTG